MKSDVAEKTVIQEPLQVVTFYIGNELYGIDIQKVLEIIKPSDITPIPNTPEYIEGVTNLRGRVIPIINLRNKFDMEKIENDKDVLVIVVETDHSIVGFMVDQLANVEKIPQELIESNPEIKSGRHSKYIKCVGNLQDKVIIVLDYNELIKDD